MKTKLVNIEEWAELMFSPSSRPHRNTIERWIKNGLIPVKRFGKSVFIIMPVEGEPLPTELSKECEQRIAHIAGKL